jgi:anti-sigma B factor antagonist
VASSRCPECGTILYSALSSPGLSTCSNCGEAIASGDRWPAREPTGWPPVAQHRNGNGAHHEPCVVKLTDDSDLADPAEVRRALHITIEEDDRRDLIVDLSQVSFIDEDLIGVLVGVVRRLRPLGRRLFVVASTVAVLQKLEITGLDHVFRLQGTRPAAIVAAAMT